MYVLLWTGISVLLFGLFIVFFPSWAIEHGIKDKDFLLCWMGGMFLSSVGFFVESYIEETFTQHQVRVRKQKIRYTFFCSVVSGSTLMALLIMY